MPDPVAAPGRGAEPAPRCPACSTPLPRVSSLAGQPEAMVELKCPTCAFVLGFIGPGVHIEKGGKRDH
jgi:hypothetical protein